MIWGFFDFWENRVFRGFACSVVEEIGAFPDLDFSIL